MQLEALVELSPKRSAVGPAALSSAGGGGAKRRRWIANHPNLLIRLILYSYSFPNRYKLIILAEPFKLSVCRMKIYITLKISLETKGKSGMVGINFSRMNVNNQQPIVRLLI